MSRRRAHVHVETALDPETCVREGNEKRRKEAPRDWEVVWEKIQRMRSKGDAPVDTYETARVFVLETHATGAGWVVRCLEIVHVTQRYN